MRNVPYLVDGYRRFMAERYPREADVYRSLADEGQAPKTMVIGCCDSRVDPAAIFSAGPGQLFVVRNVANLVPPYEQHGDYHGTSAALEFAVTGLGVETILVMGHGRCGGVQAFLQGSYEEPRPPGFIQSWMSLLKGAQHEAQRDVSAGAVTSMQQALEFASVRRSLDNLETFPFIRQSLAEGRLQLHGAYFDIADGHLLALDPADGRFRPVLQEAAQS